VRENVSQDMFDGILTSLVIPLLTPSKTSLRDVGLGLTRTFTIQENSS
jgi:hypothetical protein